MGLVGALRKKKWLLVNGLGEGGEVEGGEDRPWKLKSRGGEEGVCNRTTMAADLLCSTTWEVFQ